MKIINQTKSSLLADEVMVADRLVTRLRGLLGRKDFRRGQAMVIRHCNSIHTFFMHFPIDVLFLDSDYTVIKAIAALKPFRITPVYFNASLVIELPVGIVGPSLTTKGDILSIQ